jgi:hypothetical protein
MTDYLKGLWARVIIHWHVVLAALIASLPSLLDYLGVIDLQPILMGLGMKEATAALIVKVLPLVLAFVKPMIAVTPSEPAE